MNHVLVKAGLTTLVAMILSVGLTYTVGLFNGGYIDYLPYILSGALPCVLAFPMLVYVFRQHKRLDTAYSDLARAHGELQARSRIDHMTGLLNRESLFEAMKISRSRIENGALLVVDADHFKTINDTFGHAIGDRALKLIANALQNVTRKGDLVGRIGGEEFCVFLPAASRDTAIRVGQRIRAEVENTLFYSSEHQTYPLTISIGGALAPKNESNSQVLSSADRCLYLAKQRGRNCVVFEEERYNETHAPTASIMPFTEKNRANR